METKRSLAFEVIGLVLMALAGIGVTYLTGLLGAADSEFLKLGIGGGAAYVFAAILWGALHR